MPSRENSADAVFSSTPSILLTASNVVFAPRRRAVDDVAVLRQQSVARVDDEHDDVGLLDREIGLTRGQCTDAFFVAGQSAGIDDDEFAIAQSAYAVVAIARESRHIGDERVARAREHIEQRRLADIRTTDESDDRQHIKWRCGTRGAANGIRRSEHSGRGTRATAVTVIC